MTWKIARQIILVGLVTAETLLMLQISMRVRKAEVCNVVFKRYLESNYGLKINLDHLYRDGVKWVSDPRYDDSHQH